MIWLNETNVSACSDTAKLQRICKLLDLDRSNIFFKYKNVAKSFLIDESQSGTNTADCRN